MRRKSLLVFGVFSALVATLMCRSVYALDNSYTVTYPYYAFVENPDEPWQTVWDALDATGTVEYSDHYFDVPSTGDHPELRAVSYALALAGYENQADGYPSDSSTPNPKLTKFLGELGFDDYDSWDEASEENGHSMGTTIARKKLPSEQDLIVVAPRNYNYMTEWLSNFNVGMSGDHAGLNESAELIVERLNEYISDRQLSDYKIWIVGYSRGGSVVDLAARNINANLSDYEMLAEDFYVYTFGAPRASSAETNYANIHDVKDGNDLLLGYMFPEDWGFYNTGVYEEIHPADLEIDTAVVDISDLADSSRAFNVLADNDGLTKSVGAMKGKDFMDDWLQFIIENGFTREYFDTNVKAPLSAIMQAYQLRTLNKQSEFTSFITDTTNGVAGRVAGNAFIDLMSMGYEDIGEALANFPPYQDLVKILKGTADSDDIEDFVNHLKTYAGEYSDYNNPAVTEEEFIILKENIPELIRVLAPFIVADAKYTQETFGEEYSLFYTYSLVSNAKNLVIGHIPESIMPILKSLIPNESESSGDDEDLPVPNTGAMFITEDFAKIDCQFVTIPLSIFVTVVVTYFVKSHYWFKRKD
ncbi:hypothetical protein IIY68_02250 [Candidatus Saccharibacteria bacterium]|nr:hypothetical protein [Candidatus Saccharibacteria bacterium]